MARVGKKFFKPLAAWDGAFGRDLDIGEPAESITAVYAGDDALDWTVDDFVSVEPLTSATTQEWKTLLAQSANLSDIPAGLAMVNTSIAIRSGATPSLVRVAVASGEAESLRVNFNAAGTFGAWSGSTPDGSFLLPRDLGARDIYALDLDLYP